MRLPPLCVAACLALALSGCGGGNGDADTDPDAANPRFDREGYEALRGQVQQTGTDAFAAAADAFGVTGTLPGSGSPATQACSGAPLGVVRLVMGTTLLYPTPGPEGASEQVETAWQELGLTETAVDPDGSVSARLDVDGVGVSLLLDEGVTAQDGSDGETRRLTLTSECVVVGEDLARELD